MPEEDPLLPELISYFSEADHLELMIPILKQKSEISLRLLDWLLTESYNIEIYNKYQDALKLYGKARFSVYCRVDAFPFYYGNKESIKTTVAQLNMFRWLIENRVIEYAAGNWSKIYQKMNRGPAFFH